jgi:hypothetical protein
MAVKVRLWGVFNMVWATLFPMLAKRIRNGKYKPVLRTAFNDRKPKYDPQASI